MPVRAPRFARIRALGVLFLVVAGLVFSGMSLAQPPGPNGPPRGPIRIEPDARAQQRSYRFEDTGEDLAFAVFVSSKVSADKKNPLIIALHGLGGDGNSLVRNRTLDLAEEGGYIVAGPLGYNVAGWYGSPVIVMGGGEVDPPNLAELSEKDVMNVLAMMREEFNVDEKRTYLMGHSMGGAGALFLGQKHTADWAAVAAIAPAAFRMEPQRAEMLTTLRDAGIPVMLIQGGKDTVVPPENARRWAETMQEVGIEHEYIEQPEGDHGTVIADGMPHVFRFFAEHPKE